MNGSEWPGDSDTALTGRADNWVAAGSTDRSDELADTLILHPARRSERWRKRWPLLLVLIWGASAAVNIMLFGTGSSAPRTPAIRTTTVPRVTATAPSRPVGTPSPSQEPTLTAQPLAPISAAAYGPTGPGSGDNPSQAESAVDGSAETPWETDWYRSAAFGNLQSGTGLLIDMGRPVTITSVTIILGSTPGADVQLLTGNAPAQSQMIAEASASDAGGSVSLTMAQPESARYLLVWFTLLPPDSAGTYQAAVYDVRIEGTT